MGIVAKRGWTGIDAEQVWQMPTIFIGSPDQIRAYLRARHERFGLSYLVAGEDGLPALAEITSGMEAEALAPRVVPFRVNCRESQAAGVPCLRLAKGIRRR